MLVHLWHAVLVFNTVHVTRHAMGQQHCTRHKACHGSAVIQWLAATKAQINRPGCVFCEELQSTDSSCDCRCASSVLDAWVHFYTPADDAEGLQFTVHIERTDAGC